MRIVIVISKERNEYIILKRVSNGYSRRNLFKKRVYINVLAYEGKTMEEHRFINSEKNRENFINPNFDNSLNELFKDLFKEIEIPPINWVPKNFRDEKKL